MEKDRALNLARKVWAKKISVKDGLDRVTLLGYYETILYCTDMLAGNGTNDSLLIQDLVMALKLAAENLNDGYVRDYLTGLYNRRYFDEKLVEEISLVKRHKDYRSSLVMLDIDFFKNFNDKYGHLAGDYVLKGVAEIIRNGRPEDITCRFGGEEFIILLRDTEKTGATDVAERLRWKVGTKNWIYGEKDLGEISISGGVKEIIKNDSYDSAIREVNAYLHRAKDAGRNRIL